MFHSPRTISLIALALSALSSIGWSQQGDSKDAAGTVQKEIWKEIDVPPAPILGPQEALETLRVAPGFRVELAASEPLVNDPVAIAWDPDGRIWACEMWGYMPDIDGLGEGKPVGRVVVLEDDDNDGIMDRSTVFLDGLIMPRSIAFVEGGVLIGDPPKLLYCQDNDGDLVCDETRVVGEYATNGPVEHAENGLSLNINNWMYNARSTRKFKFADGKLHAESTAFRGQWGVTQDDYGRVFYNHNSAWLSGDLFPWKYVSGNPDRKGSIGIGHRVARSNKISTHRINPGVNRGYRDGVIGDDYRLVKVTGISGLDIYRGDSFPDAYRGNAFVPDVAGNVVGRFSLEEDGVSVDAVKKLSPHPKWGQVEFLGSSDERFRPVNCHTGPDGNLYVIDMYRGLIQHRIYVTSFLRKQTIERGLDQPVGLGRIYRIVHESNDKPKPQPRLSNASELELVATLQHPNGWWRDTAQRLLVERKPSDSETIAALIELVASGNEKAKIHALWTLAGIDKLDTNTIQGALADDSDWVRVHALRTAEETTDRNTFNSILTASIANDAFRVRLQSFQMLAKFGDSELTVRSFIQASEKDWKSPFMIDAARSSLVGLEIPFMEAALASSKWSSPKKKHAIFERFGGSLFNSRRTASVVSILEGANLEKPNPIEASFLEGLQDVVEQRGAIPLEIESEASFLTKLNSKKLRDNLSKGFTWPGKPGAPAPRAKLTEEQQLLVDKGATLFQSTCSTCHGPNGEGVAGLAPELIQVRWVLDSPERIALIVADGLAGDIFVNGKRWKSVMPPHKNHPNLAGDGLAAVLSYVRQSWSNNAPPISPEELSAILKEHSKGNATWSPEELDEKFPFKLEPQN